MRLQQGVPLVDADWNEMDDIRKYELRTFLKWFVGDGIPQQNNDAFRIVATPAANDFIIKGGDGTWQGAARCLVDGWEVFNPGDIKYTEQELYTNTALAKAWDVTKLPPLLAPVPTSSFNAQRTDTVYLDIWERPVDSLEDSTLNNEAIGIETSVRMKREWVVRVEVNASKPPAPPPGHAYYALARLDRRAREEVISTERITDLRRTGLTLMSQHDVTQITKDAFGEAYALNQSGMPQLKVSLRDAINALLVREIPTTKEVVLAESSGAWTVFKDSQQDVWLVWDNQPTSAGSLGLQCQHYRNGQMLDSVYLAGRETAEMISRLQIVEDGKRNIWICWEQRKGAETIIMYRRYVRNAISPWEPAAVIATTSVENAITRVVADHQGDVWVFWVTKGTNGDIILLRRYNSNGESTGDLPAAQSGGTAIADLQILVDQTGDIWLIWQQSRTDFQGINSHIYGCQFKLNNKDWMQEESVCLSQFNGWSFSPFILQDNKSNRWLFWNRSKKIGENVPPGIWYRVLRRDAYEWDEPERLTESDDHLFNPICDKAGQLWVFWCSNGSGVKYKRKVGDKFGTDIELTTDNSSAAHLANIFLDSRGDMWVFWIADNHIWYKCYGPERGWGRATALTKNVGINSSPVVYETADGNLGIMWKRQATPESSAHVMHKELVLGL